MSQTVENAVALEMRMGENRLYSIRATFRDGSMKFIAQNLSAEMYALGLRRFVESPKACNEIRIHAYVNHDRLSKSQPLVPSTQEALHVYSAMQSQNQGQANGNGYGQHQQQQQHRGGQGPTRSQSRHDVHAETSSGQATQGQEDVGSAYSMMNQAPVHNRGMSAGTPMQSAFQTIFENEGDENNDADEFGGPSQQGLAHMFPSETSIEGSR